MNYRGISIPFTQMGNVTSDNLFDPNEQVIFDFYEANRSRYRRAIDIGANLGVHSILMARNGWEVAAFEPDPEHFARLVENIAAHGCRVLPIQAAVSDRAGVAEFVRVLDNTTASHLAGARPHYGPTETITVAMVDCRPLMAWADFAKIDCEGHEATLIGAADIRVWDNLEALLEVGSPAAAQSIYDRLIGVVPLYAQKIGWARVMNFADMPTCHQEGSLFIGGKSTFCNVTPRLG